MFTVQFNFTVYEKKIYIDYYYDSVTRQGFNEMTNLNIDTRRRGIQSKAQIVVVD